MMTKDEALKMVIDYEIELPEHVINACKEALEQPAQDYVLICKRCGDDIGIEYVLDEQQEPYAYAYVREDGVGQLCWTKKDASLFKDLLDGWKEIPLYTKEK
jgi:hypothetical protein